MFVLSLKRRDLNIPWQKSGRGVRRKKKKERKKEGE